MSKEKFWSQPIAMVTGALDNPGVSYGVLQQLPDGRNKILLSHDAVLKALNSAANDLKNIHPTEFAKVFHKILLERGIADPDGLLKQVKFEGLTVPSRGSVFVGRGPKMEGLSVPDWVKKMGPGGFPDSPLTKVDINNVRDLGEQVIFRLPQPKDIIGSREQLFGNSATLSLLKNDFDGDIWSFTVAMLGGRRHSLGGPRKSPVLGSIESYRIQDATLADILKLSDYDFLNLGTRAKALNLSPDATKRFFKASMYAQLGDATNAFNFAENEISLLAQNTEANMGVVTNAVQKVTFADAMQLMVDNPGLSSVKALSLSMRSGKQIYTEIGAGAVNKGLDIVRAYDPYDIKAEGSFLNMLSKDIIGVQRTREGGYSIRNRLDPTSGFVNFFKLLDEENVGVLHERPTKENPNPYSGTILIAPKSEEDLAQAKRLALGGDLLKERTRAEMVADADKQLPLALESRLDYGVNPGRINEVLDVLKDVRIAGQAIDVNVNQVDFAAKSARSLTAPVIPKAYALTKISETAGGQIGFQSGLPYISVMQRDMGEGHKIYTGTTYVLPPVYVTEGTNITLHDPMDMIAQITLAHSIEDPGLPNALKAQGKTHRVFGEVQAGNLWSVRRTQLRNLINSVGIDEATGQLVAMDLGSATPASRAITNQRDMYLQRGKLETIAYYKEKLARVEKESAEELAVLRQFQYNIDTTSGGYALLKAEWEQELDTLMKQTGLEVRTHIDPKASTTIQGQTYIKKELVDDVETDVLRTYGVHQVMGQLHFDDDTSAYIHQRAFFTGLQKDRLIRNVQGELVEKDFFGFETAREMTNVFRDHLDGLVPMGNVKASYNGFAAFFARGQSDYAIASGKRYAQMATQSTQAMGFNERTLLVDLDVRGELQQLYHYLSENPLAVPDFAEKLPGEGMLFLSQQGRQTIRKEAKGSGIHQFDPVSWDDTLGDWATHDKLIIDKYDRELGATVRSVHTIQSAAEQVEFVLQHPKIIRPDLKTTGTNVEHITGGGYTFGVALMVGETDVKRATPGLLFEGLRNRAAEGDTVIGEYLNKHLPDKPLPEDYGNFLRHVTSDPKHMEEFEVIADRLKVNATLTLAGVPVQGTGYDLGVIRHRLWTGAGGRPGELNKTAVSSSNTPIAFQSIEEFMRNLFKLDPDISESVMLEAIDRYYVASGKKASAAEIQRAIRIMESSGYGPGQLPKPGTTYRQLRLNADFNENGGLTIIGAGPAEGIDISDLNVVHEKNLLNHPGVAEAIADIVKKGEMVHKGKKITDPELASEIAAIARRQTHPPSAVIVDIMTKAGLEGIAGGIPGSMPVVIIPGTVSMELPSLVRRVTKALAKDV